MSADVVFDGSHINLPGSNHDLRRRAALYVASRAIDADDCRELLDMLGLREGK